MTEHPVPVAGARSRLAHRALIVGGCLWLLVVGWWASRYHAFLHAEPLCGTDGHHVPCTEAEIAAGLASATAWFVPGLAMVGAGVLLQLARDRAVAPVRARATGVAVGAFALCLAGPLFLMLASFSGVHAAVAAGIAVGFALARTCAEAVGRVHGARVDLVAVYAGVTLAGVLAVAAPAPLTWETAPYAWLAATAVLMAAYRATRPRPARG